MTVSPSLNKTVEKTLFWGLVGLSSVLIIGSLFFLLTKPMSGKKVVLPPARKGASLVWTNSAWMGIVFVFLCLFVGISATQEGDKEEFILIGLAAVLSALLAFPYIHYRVKGGEVQRIPPRFVPEKKFVEKAS